MSFIYWHPEGWMWQPAPNQTDDLPRSTGISASRTVSLGPPRCIVFLEPLFWFSLISAQPCRRFGSADLKKFISVPGILHKSSPVELELTIFWRQHCQGCTDMGPESVTVSEISEQCGYREASLIRPTRLCLQKLLILFVLPICSVLPPLNREVAYLVRRQNNLQGHSPFQQQSVNRWPTEVSAPTAVMSSIHSYDSPRSLPFVG